MAAVESAPYLGSHAGNTNGSQELQPSYQEAHPPHHIQSPHQQLRSPPQPIQSPHQQFQSPPQTEEPFSPTSGPGYISAQNSRTPLVPQATEPFPEPQTPNRQHSQRYQTQELQRWYPNPDDFPRPPMPGYHVPHPNERRLYRDTYPESSYYDEDSTRPPRAYRRSTRTAKGSFSTTGPRPGNAGRSTSFERGPNWEDQYAGDDGGHGGGNGGGRYGDAGYGPGDSPGSRRARTFVETAETKEVLRLPWIMWMNSNAKNHFVASLGEFVGTTMFLFFAFAGTQVANIQSSAGDSTTTGGSTGFSPIVLLYISLIFSFSLMVNVWVFFRISGGLFNPAVTLAMLIVRAVTVARAICLVFAQIVGSIFASFLVQTIFPTELNVRTTLSNQTSLARGIFIEAILTGELVFTILMLAKEKHKATFIAPVGIGLALFIAELVGVFYTGGSLNPARSFGPCVVTGVWDSEHWIYWLGPAMGALFAVIFYKFIKILEYEAAVPAQDADSEQVSNRVKEDIESQKELRRYTSRNQVQ